MSGCRTLPPPETPRSCSSRPCSPQPSPGRTLPVRCWPALLTLLGALALAACGGPPGGEAPAGEVAAIPDAVALAGITLESPDGEAVPLTSLLGETPAAFLFIRTDCPISNRYAPEVDRLARRHAGARFFLVYPDPAVTAEEIEQHLRDYGYTLPALTDPHHALVAATGVRVTPEVAVFDASGRLVYRGRIDDRWVAFGQLRAEPEHRDLTEVLADLEKGRTPDPRSTPTVGCYIADLS